MIIFRNAGPADASAIAQLHAENWQKNYRGILRDEYLDNEVHQERAELWADRFAHPQNNRQVILAEQYGELIGFACIEVNENATYGSLLDNLHVSSAAQGQGIGALLMQKAAAWAESQHPGIGFYLWVFEANHHARKFYEHLGAHNEEMVMHENPGGGSASIYRYIWRKATDLMGARH